MDDFNIQYDNDTKPIDINIDNDINSVGIELLADPNKNKVDSPMEVQFDHSNNDNEINLFSNKPELETEKNNLFNQELYQDPLINDISNKENNVEPNVSSNREIPVHLMTPNDIKNEKIELIYKFKRLDSQGIRTTMNYNMDHNFGRYEK